MDQQLILNMINSRLDSTDTSYDMDKTNMAFNCYIPSHHLNISMFNFREHNFREQITFDFTSRDTYESVYVHIDFEMAKPTLDRVFKGYRDEMLVQCIRQANNKINTLNSQNCTQNNLIPNVDFNTIATHIDFIDNYLKTTDLSHEFKENKAHVEKHVCSDKNSYILTMDKLIKPYFLTSVLKFKFSVQDESSLQGEFLVPAWEIENYKAFNASIKINAVSDTEFANQLKSINSSLGREYLSYPLSKQLEENLTPKAITKKSKI